MAELHANQIAFQAPEPKNAKFDREGDYFVTPLARLAEKAQETVEYESRLRDIDIGEKLTALQNDMKDNIAKADATEPADYERLKVDAAQRWAEEMAKFDEATVQRFNNTHPQAFAAYQLDVANAVYEKRREQTLKAVENDIPRLTSEAVAGTYGPGGRGYVVKKIQAQLEGVAPQHQIDAVLDKAHSEIDRYEISALVVAGKWAEARKYLANIKDSATISPSARVRWEEVINNAEAQEMKAKEAAKKNGEDPRFVAMQNAVAKMVQDTSTAAPTDAKIENYIRAVAKGYNPVGRNPDGTWAVEFMKDVSPADAVEWAKKLQQIATESPTSKQAAAVAVSNLQIALDEVEGKKIDEIDPMVLAEIEELINQPYIYNNSDTSVAPLVRKATDILNRSYLINRAQSWAEASEQEYIQRYRALSPFTRRVDAPWKVARETINVAEAPDQSQRTEIAQALTDLTYERKRRLEKTGHPVKRGSVADFAVGLSTAVQSGQISGMREALGLQDVSDMRLAQIYDQFIATLIKTDEYNKELVPETAAEITKAYIAMARGYPVYVDEEQDKAIKRVTDWIVTGTVQDNFKYPEWMQNITSGSSVSAHRFTDVTGGRGTYVPINKYNKKVGE